MRKKQRAPLTPPRGQLGALSPSLGGADLVLRGSPGSPSSPWQRRRAVADSGWADPQLTSRFDGMGSGHSPQKQGLIWGLDTLG